MWQNHTNNPGGIAGNQNLDGGWDLYESTSIVLGACPHDADNAEALTITTLQKLLFTCFQRLELLAPGLV